MTAEKKSYYSEQWNFSITYPADWEIVHENEPVDPWVMVVAIASLPGRQTAILVNARRGEALARFPQISVGRDGTVVQEPTTPQEFIQVQREGLARSFRNFSFHFGEELELLDKPAVRTVYSYDGDRERRKELCITWFGVGVTFQFIGEASAAEFDRWQPVFDRVIESFRIGKGEVTVLQTEEALEEASPVQLYNTGVALYREGQYREAKTFFRRCYQSGAYPMQAAYAESLCNRELGRKPVIPKELKGREDETGAVYVASNLACYLVQEGHRAALTKMGEISEVSASIEGSRYLIQTSCHPLFGSFEHFVSFGGGRENFDLPSCQGFSH